MADMVRRLGALPWLLVAVVAPLVGCGDDEAADDDGTQSSSASSSGAGGGGGGGGSALSPAAEFIPTPSGSCPEFAQGTITVTPDGKPRDVEIWISEVAAEKDGPLVFYWHGTGSSPTLEPPYGLGQDNVDAILAEGGIVAAAHAADDSGTFPWYLTTGGDNEGDLRVADEVLACAIEKVGVDLRRIHSIGMSAGGLNTTQMSWRRSGYLASVVTYSGGELSKPEVQDPSNKFAAMIFHGGDSDTVIIDFKPISEKYRDTLRADGHFAFICDHGMGHDIPVDAVDSVHQFFVDHPFGTQPSPYAEGLPAGFPSYCSL